MESFKQCSHCQHSWGSREDFLGDQQIELVGYQSFLEDLVLGLFLFNHLKCETTLAIRAKSFVDLYEGPIYGERCTHTPKCSGLCLNEKNLKPCPNKCECAYVREVLQRVKDWPKAQG